MGCLPVSGGCEHRFLQPFVEHLNSLERTLYRHKDCLDVKIHNTPQPEALYIDDFNGRRMVIERKCIVWPKDYAIRHKNDHYLADRLYEELPQWAARGPYTIHLPGLLRGTRQELRAFAQQIAARVLAHGPLCHAREMVGNPKPHPWLFRHRAAIDDDEAPLDTLLVTWDLPPEHGLAPWPVPLAVRDEFLRVLAAAAKKFDSYRDHRCVVLLEPQGALSHTPLEWWLSLDSSACAVPLDELWIAEQDFGDPDGKVYWTFERLIPLFADMSAQATTVDREL